MPYRCRKRIGQRLNATEMLPANMRTYLLSTQAIAARSARRGAVVPLVAIMLPVIVVLASFAVNLSYIELTRTELRISADAATRAAGRTLINTNDVGLARAAARQAATRNQVAGAALQLADADIEFGLSQRTSLANRYSFTAGGSHPNAVRITARRNSGSLSGAVSVIMPSSGATASFNTAQSAISSRVELDVALVLDRSGSMVYGDSEHSYNMAVAGLPPASAERDWEFCDPAPAGSRWRDLLAGVGVFNTVLNQSFSEEHVTLITYASSAKVDLDLTGDYTAILNAMDPYTQSLCAGATNVGDGIDTAINALFQKPYSREWAAKVIVVLTDGKHNTGSNPEYAAAYAANAGITVYTITFSSEADQSKMAKVAAAGKGEHFHAADAQALQQAFIDIARSLPTLLTD